MKNQITVFLIMFGLLLWVIQVVNLNRGKENNVMYVEQGQEFYYGGLAIQADEFLLLDSDEYGTYFGMENDVADSEKAVCVRLMVRNDSDEAISWDDIFSVIGEAVAAGGIRTAGR